MQDDVKPQDTQQPNISGPNPAAPTTQDFTTSQPPVAATPFGQENNQFSSVAPPPVPVSTPSTFDSEQTAGTPVPGFSQPPKSSKKRFVVAGIIAGVIVLFGGVGAAAYNLWYQNPDKVIGDSLANMISAKSVTGTGEFTFDNKESSLKLTLDHASGPEEGRVNVQLAVNVKQNDMKVDLSGEGLYTKDGDLYVRVTKLDEAYAKFVNTYVDSLAKQYADYGMSMTPAMKKSMADNFDKKFKPIIAKIDNKWIKISAADLKEVSQDSADTQACVQKATDMLRDDARARGEVADLYKNNKFIIIKDTLGSKDGSLGYSVDFDKDASKKFGEGLEKTAVGKQLESCDTSDDAKSAFSTDEKTESDDMKDLKAELWVSRWSHQVTKFTMSGSTTDKSNTSFNMNYSPTFNQDVTVEAPKDSITIKQLQGEISTLSSLV